MRRYIYKEEEPNIPTWQKVLGAVLTVSGAIIIYWFSNKGL